MFGVYCRASSPSCCLQNVASPTFFSLDCSVEQFGHIVLNVVGDHTSCLPVLVSVLQYQSPLQISHSSHHLIYPLSARVVGTPQMILQPVSSIFPCSPLPSGTWRTPGLSIPDVVFPPLPLSTLPSSPFHRAFQVTVTENGS